MTKLTVSEQLQLGNYMITGYIGGSCIWANAGTVSRMALETKQSDGAYVDHVTYTSNMGTLNTRFLGTKGDSIPLNSKILSAYTNSVVQLFSNANITQSAQLLLNYGNNTRDTTQNFYLVCLIYPDQWSTIYLDPNTVIQPYSITEMCIAFNTNQMHSSFGDGADYLHTSTQYLYDSAYQATTNYTGYKITTVTGAAMQILNVDGSITHIHEYSEDSGMHGLCIRPDQIVKILGAIYSANDNTCFVNEDNTAISNCIDVTDIFDNFVQTALSTMRAIIEGTDIRQINPFIAAYPGTDGLIYIVIDSSKFNQQFTNPAEGHPKVFTFNLVFE